MEIIVDDQQEYNLMRLLLDTYWRGSYSLQIRERVEKVVIEGVK